MKKSKDTFGDRQPVQPVQPVKLGLSENCEVTFNFMKEIPYKKVHQKIEIAFKFT